MIYRLGILASHPIQYQAPLFRELARHVDLKVYFAHRQTAQEQAASGFNVAFDWDVDLLGGYEHQFLCNQAKHPSVNDFFGCDTPEIKDEISDGQFDAFLVMGWYMKSFWQSIFACRRYGVPVMVRGDSQLRTPRGWLKQLGKEVLYPRLLRQFDACLYVGQRNREYFEYYNVSSKRLFFSPHCIDNDRFVLLAKQIDRSESRKRICASPSQKVVLFVGKLLDKKRPLDLLHALRILREHGMDVCGLFAGDGPLRNRLETTAIELSVPSHFLGFRNQSELPEAYVQADVMVLPSEGGETWGLVINEALACGTRVVVSDAVGCAVDLVIEGKTGLVYPVGDTVALADALRQVLSVAPARKHINAVSNIYSIENAARGIIEGTASLSNIPQRALS